MTVQYAYEDVIRAAKRVNWSVEDLIGQGQKLDFEKPFLPEDLARTGGLHFMSPREKVIFNQIRGHGYLYIFSVLEEIILPFIEDHARREGIETNAETEAFLQFADEEAKHIELFTKFREEFQAGFKTDISVIGPVAAIAEAIMAHHPLAVALVTLHIEWMTQDHYLSSVKNNAALCPQFESLLRHHWMEEAQHAKLDTNMVLTLGAGLPHAELQQVTQDYFKIVAILDSGLQQQATFDREAFEKATDRTLTLNNAAACEEAQKQALRWTYLGSGMNNPNFLSTLETLAPFMRDAVESVSPQYC